MKALNTLKLVGLMVLGCSSEHTIADETTTEQSVQVQPRAVCVDMCNYSLDCGQLNEDELTTCQTTCENNCKRLEAALPDRIDVSATVSKPTSQSIINDVSACYLASACSLDKDEECYPEHIATEASNYEQNPSSINSDDTQGNSFDYSNYAVVTPCYTQPPSGETCRFASTQTNDAKQRWSFACSRPSAESQEWTLQCFKDGVETKTLTIIVESETTNFGKFCWTDEELACFHANRTDC